MLYVNVAILGLHVDLTQLVSFLMNFASRRLKKKYYFPVLGEITLFEILIVFLTFVILNSESYFFSLLSTSYS